MHECRVEDRPNGLFAARASPRDLRLFTAGNSIFQIGI